jgi:hypothetical protein
MESSQYSKLLTFRVARTAWRERQMDAITASNRDMTALRFPAGQNLGIDICRLFVEWPLWRDSPGRCISDCVSQPGPQRFPQDVRIEDDHRSQSGGLRTGCRSAMDSSPPPSGSMCRRIAFARSMFRSGFASECTLQDFSRSSSLGLPWRAARRRIVMLAIKQRSRCNHQVDEHSEAQRCRPSRAATGGAKQARRCFSAITPTACRRATHA